MLILRTRIELDEKEHKDTRIAMDGMGDLKMSVKELSVVGSSMGGGDSFTTDEGYERAPHVHPAG